MCEWFSSRERDIGPKAEQELADFRDRKGREPTAFERNHLLRTATLATRAPKSHDGLTHEEQLDQWATQAEAIMVGGLAEVARNALAYRGQTAEPAAWSEREVKALAVARAAQGKQTWSRSDAMRAAGDVLPADLGLAPSGVRPFLEHLTDTILAEATQTKKAQSPEGAPPELRLANGQLAFVQPGTERWAAPDQIAAEGVLRAAAVERGAGAVSLEQVDAVLARFAESGIELGPDQAAAVRGVLTSGAWVEVISAAAGTGKSFTVGVINETWREVGGGRLFGLTTAQNAADVLTDEDGVPAANSAPTDWVIDAAITRIAIALAPPRFSVINVVSMARQVPSAHGTRFRITPWTCNCGSPLRESCCRNWAVTNLCASVHNPAPPPWCPIREYPATSCK